MYYQRRRKSTTSLLPRPQCSNGHAKLSRALAVCSESLRSGYAVDLYEKQNPHPQFPSLRQTCLRLAHLAVAGPAGSLDNQDLFAKLKLLTGLLPISPLIRPRLFATPPLRIQDPGEYYRFLILSRHRHQQSQRGRDIRRGDSRRW